MRTAPAVDAQLGAARLERGLIVLLYAVAGAALGFWSSAHLRGGQAGAALPSSGWMAGTAALAMAAAGWVLARRALPAQPARLVWDGAAWHLRAGAAQALRRLVVAIDLGRWMLLQLTPTDGSARSWRVASARSAGADWHGLRVALQAHAGDPSAGAERAGASS